MIVTKKEIKYKVKYLHKNGWKAEAIAEELKLSVATVYRYLK